MHDFPSLHSVGEQMCNPGMCSDEVIVLQLITRSALSHHSETEGITTEWISTDI